MNRHSKGDLQQMQSLPLSAKVMMSERRLIDWADYYHGDVYIGFSGGIDSVVLKYIADGLHYKFPSVFANTGLEYPEIQKFVRDVKAGKFSCFNPDVEIIRPEMRFDEVIKKYGYPVISKTISKKVGTVQRNGKGCQTYRFFKGEAKSEDGRLSIFNCPKWEFLIDAPFKVDYFCCEIMKKKPFKAYESRTGRKPIIGVMASESKTREAVWYRHGCNMYDSKHPVSQPLSFWTKQDILHFIKEFNVPYCPVYGEIRVAQHNTIDGQMNMIDYLGCYEPEDVLETTGCDRTGCMFCAYGITQDGTPNRFQRMKVTHPKQWAYCMDQLGLKEVLEYIGVPYE
jgi:3'-phosphoadenosine 5'-phosphosulfate sulfotransferase (PAPS reductase)/FAD synthetase